MFRIMRLREGVVWKPVYRASLDGAFKVHEEAMAKDLAPAYSEIAIRIAPETYETVAIIKGNELKPTRAEERLSIKAATLALNKAQRDIEAAYDLERTLTRAASKCAWCEWEKNK